MLKYEQGYKEPNFVSASVVRLPTSDTSLLTPAYHPKLPIFFACMCVFTRMRVHICVGTYACTCEGQRFMSGVILHHS